MLALLDDPRRVAAERESERRSRSAKALARAERQDAMIVRRRESARRRARAAAKSERRLSRELAAASATARSKRRASREQLTTIPAESLDAADESPLETGELVARSEKVETRGQSTKTPSVAETPLKHTEHGVLAQLKRPLERNWVFWLVFASLAYYAAWGAMDRIGFTEAPEWDLHTALVCAVLQTVIYTFIATFFVIWLVQTAGEQFPLLAGIAGFIATITRWWLLVTALNFALTIEAGRKDAGRAVRWFEPYDEKGRAIAGASFASQLTARVHGVTWYVPTVQDSPTTVLHKFGAVAWNSLGLSGASFVAASYFVDLSWLPQVLSGIVRVIASLFSSWLRRMERADPERYDRVMRRIQLVVTALCMLLALLVIAPNVFFGVVDHLSGLSIAAFVFGDIANTAQFTLNDAMNKRRNAEVAEKLKKQQDATTSFLKQVNSVVKDPVGTLLNETALAVVGAKQVEEPVYGPPTENAIVERLRAMVTLSGACDFDGSVLLLYDLPAYCSKDAQSVPEAFATDYRLSATRARSIIAAVASSDWRLAAKIAEVNKSAAVVGALESWLLAPDWFARDEFLSKLPAFTDSEKDTIKEAVDQFDLRVNAFYSFENISKNFDVFQYLGFDLEVVLNKALSGKTGFIGSEQMRYMVFGAESNTYSDRQVVENFVRKRCYQITERLSDEECTRCAGPRILATYTDLGLGSNVVGKAECAKVAGSSGGALTKYCKRADHEPIPSVCGFSA